MSPLLYAIFGIALGFIIGWLVRSLRSAQPDNRVENELRHQLGQREADLSQARSQLTETSNARAAAEAKESATAKLLVEEREIHEQSLREARHSQEKALADMREAF